MSEEDSRQKTEDRRQRAEGRRQKTEDSRQKAEGRSQKTEVRRQKKIKKQLKVEYVAIDTLKEWDRNPRKNDETVDAVVRSIEKFGYTNPILVRRKDNRIIAGHTRVKALKEIGEKKAPVIFLDIGKTDADLYALFDNKSTENTPWDIPKLSDLFVSLKDINADISLTGFSPEEIEAYTGTEVKEGLTDDDQIPETPKKPKTKTGDLYILGEHRLLCGDSTKAEDVERLMVGQKADMVFTSPPYWVGFEYEKEKDKESILAHISKSSSLMAIFVKGKIIINTGNIDSITIAEKITGKKQPALLIDWWIDALNRNNYLLRHIRIWAKGSGIMLSRRNDKIAMNWEYIALLTNERGNAGFIATFKNAKDNEGQNLHTPEWAVKGYWTDIQGKAREAGHPASFPVELVTRYLVMYTKREQIQLEPYAGAGTSLIACEKLGRRCYGMEIDPVYCDVIVKRWQEFTGKKAKLGNRR